jgi:hypothetical protein
MKIVIKDWGNGWNTYEQLISIEGLDLHASFKKLGLRSITQYSYEVIDKQLFMLAVIRHGIVYGEVKAPCREKKI